MVRAFGPVTGTVLVHDRHSFFCSKGHTESESMKMKTAGMVLFAFVSLTLIYLATVAIWSRASIDDALSQYSSLPSETGLSKRQTEILLAVEDPTFFEHGGLSLSDGQGLTTITSVVAREVFLFHTGFDGAKGAFQSLYRSVFACCKKVDIGRDVMALVLNSKLSKEQQLALYVSQVYMGTNQGSQIIGLREASLAYVGKPMTQLNDKEFSGLVAMIKAPNYFHPVRNHAAFALRAARIDAVVAGRCRPSGWFDTSFSHCKP
jgi:hypothetical protein